ncbi:hypothetical protein BT69DRAFT_1331336 [Atractiella rhizophila]|nr:hypothetical protein BT69DRAFT_1331336 [Atractiella rhizophila]
MRPNSMSASATELWSRAMMREEWVLNLFEGVVVIFLVQHQLILVMCLYRLRLKGGDGVDDNWKEFTLDGPATLKLLLLLSLFASSSVGAALPTSSASERARISCRSEATEFDTAENHKLGSIPKARLGYTSNQKPTMPAVIHADQLKKFDFHVPYYAGFPH